MHYLAVLIWTLLNLLAYVGYGRYFLRFVDGPELRWPFAATIGIAFVIAIGGALNLAALLTKSVLIAIVALGFLLWLIACSGKWRQICGEIRTFLRDVSASFWKSGIAIILLMLLVASFLGNIVTSRFMPFDDLAAYGDYAVETAQLGMLPANPFGERRIVSSLGGGYLLQAITFVAGDVRSIYVPDLSLGYLLAIGAAYWIARRRLSNGLSLLIASLVFALCFLLFNASFYILPEALILTMFWLGLDRPRRNRRWIFRCALLGLCAAALVTLKSTYVPFAFFFCIFLFAAYGAIYRRAYIVPGILTCAASTFAVLFTWMLDQHSKEGTWLFPVLGRGFDASAYAGFVLPSGSAGLMAFRWTIWKYSLPFLILWSIVIVCLLVWRNLYRDAEWPALLAMACATMLATFATVATTGADSVTRYTGPIQIPAIIVVTAALGGWVQQRRVSPWRLFGLGAAVGGVACIFFWNGPIRQDYLMQYPEFLLQRKGIGKRRIDYDRQVAIMRKIQAAVPPREAILVVTMPSYDFDVRRNRIFVDDFPGGAGPPPGPPITADSGRLRRYLLKYGIHYIAFTRGYTAPDDPSDMPVYMADLKRIVADPSRDGVYTWERMQQATMSLRGAQIQDLSHRYSLVYDDGKNIVIDLDRPS